MSPPWLKFFPADWRGDPKLRACSLEARGLWMEMLCIMHEADPVGYLLIGKSPPTLKQLASISGGTLKSINRLLRELEHAEVFSRENGIIFSRRMVRDNEKAAKDKANGGMGGNPKLMPGVNPPNNPKDKAHIPEARGQLINGFSKKEEARPSEPFPPDGSIAYSPFAEIARKQGRGGDPDIFASAFRLFCFVHKISFNDPQIDAKFGTFCMKHKVQGLHS